MSHPLAVPASFRQEPRWWVEGDSWLDALPDLVASMCQRWGLDVDGQPRHGANALVVPVRRCGDPFALRLTPPDERFRADTAALQFWDGRGTVRLIQVDLARGVSLLERLDGSRSLADLPLQVAVPIMGRVLRRLAVPAPSDVPSTADLAQRRLAEMPSEWEKLGRPFDRAVLKLGLVAGTSLVETSSTLAVNGDFHFEQVLAGTREPWLVVDPLLLRGDVAYDLARVMWSRLDEMADDAEIRHWLAVLVHEAELETDRAWAWTRFRTVDYWLWGLSHGLTEDPVRCGRLLAAIAGRCVRGR